MFIVILSKELDSYYIEFSIMAVIARRHLQTQSDSKSFWSIFVAFWLHRASWVLVNFALGDGLK